MNGNRRQGRMASSRRFGSMEKVNYGQPCRSTIKIPQPFVLLVPALHACRQESSVLT